MRPPPPGSPSLAAAAVAPLNPDDLDALTSDPRVIRNRRKIEATVDNAHQMLEAEKAHGSPSTGPGQW